MASVILDIQGTTVAEEEHTFLQHSQTAGVILFARNIDTFAQTQALCAQLRAINPELLICVDQEGGRVQRLAFDGLIERLPPMRCLGDLYDENAASGLQAAHSLGWLMAQEVQSVGIDFSFAPVLDRDYQHSQIIGNRAFHSDKAILAELAEQFILGMQEAGMAATAKHFPGHGFVAPDSHLELPIDERTFADIASEDIVPFAQLAQRYKGVMPAHIVYEQVDDKPACFSSHWLNTVLRQQLGFDGVIFSDDISMQGAAIIGDYAERTRQALQAGCDIVLICNTPEAQQQVLDAAQAVNKSPNPIWADFKGGALDRASENFREGEHYAQALAYVKQLQE